MIGMIP